MSLAALHPAVQRWFSTEVGTPSPPQADGWPAILSGSHTLIAAPTGSGKTLAAFLCAIDALVREGLEHGSLPDETRVLYVSPLKALGNDIEKNLQLPLAGIGRALEAMGLPEVAIRTLVRTGDTSQKDRAGMRKRPPHILVTTPETFYMLLTSESGRKSLASVRTLIVDEIHALVADRRGAHLALSMERLSALVPHTVQRIGLSATQSPISEVAKFLVGDASDSAQSPPALRANSCKVIDHGHRRDLHVEIELPGSPLEAVMPHEVWDELYDRLAELIAARRTTLVFVNTRRLSERVAKNLADRLGETLVTSHHGSLSREHRLRAEQRLKAGELKALVATASLELGIDVGSVDLVCQIGSTRSIASFLQRVGRSGHRAGALSEGRLFPLTRDELVECVALVSALRRGELDRVCVARPGLDVLSQQIVASVAAEGEWGEDELFALARRAYPYRELARSDFDHVVTMLAEGFVTARGRRGALIHHDRVNHKLRPRKNARITAITCGGAIPDNADYAVVLSPSGTLVGSINEDFAIESMAGDIFQLGNSSWRILKVEPGTVRVEDAQGAPPTIPFWLGEAPGRSAALSTGVSDVRAEVDAALRGAAEGEQNAAAARVLQARGASEVASAQLAEYLSAAQAALGQLPTQDTLVAERFFDESGGMQLVIHAPFGSRLNRAFGLALRKRFCRAFNFELQAAATEDAIVLSLGPTHSFPLAEIRDFLHAKSVRDVLVQALLDAPMFETRFRWNATRSLAVKRWEGGKKTPPRLLRMRTNDLLSLVFPDQQACLENIQGEREIPDHPLVKQTIDDCLHDAMDIDALEALLSRLERDDAAFVFRDLTEPSPLSAEILGARPYAFLDDAPLEERRTQAVIARRFMDRAHAETLATLDPAAIERVVAEAWPEPRDRDELHDALATLGCMTARELVRLQQTRDAEAWLDALASERRATRVALPSGERLICAAERIDELRAVHPEAVLEPAISAPAAREGVATASITLTRDDALLSLLQSRVDALG
ncbi:MAG TPA: DEAD/DEAH box helicase, partial [Polyangiales bacterium]|nr:DEAD/DEAH box helicase [Polyangiales bacterium]